MRARLARRMARRTTDAPTPPDIAPGTSPRSLRPSPGSRFTAHQATQPSHSLCLSVPMGGLSSACFGGIVRSLGARTPNPYPPKRDSGSARLTNSPFSASVGASRGQHSTLLLILTRNGAIHPAGGRREVTYVRGVEGTIALHHNGLPLIGPRLWDEGPYPTP
jgi:hypothetical protein